MRQIIIKGPFNYAMRDHDLHVRIFASGGSIKGSGGSLKHHLCTRYLMSYENEISWSK